MAKKHLVSIVTSLTLHALLLAQLLIQPKVLPVRKTDMVVDLIESVSVEGGAIARERPSEPKSTSISASRSANQKSEAKPALQIGDDFLKNSLSRAFGNSAIHQAQDTPSDNQNHGDGHGWSIATQETNRMTVQKTLETLPFFISLHNRINASLVYPDDFSRQRITGRVRIEAELNQDGTLRRFLTSTTNDQLLQTYCFALLLQALSRPLPTKTHLTHGETIATSFEFEFHTRVVGNPKREFPTIIQKNHLAFGRENEVDPIVTERIQEIFTHYVPPIIPLPGGVYIDFVMAYQLVQNIINGAPTEREMRQSRIETLHEDLRRFVRIGSSPTPTATPES